MEVRAEGLVQGRTKVLGVNMLFDPRPKTKREDLFYREKELGALA